MLLKPLKFWKIPWWPLIKLKCALDPEIYCLKLPISVSIWELSNSWKEPDNPDTLSWSKLLFPILRFLKKPVDPVR